MSEPTARWSRWANYYAVTVVVLVVFLLAIHQLGPANPVFRVGRWLIAPLFFFFMVAFVPATIMVIHEIRRRPVSKKNLFLYSAVLVLTLLLQPHLQPYLLPFDSLHAKALERRAIEQHVIGQTEAIAIAALGEPTFAVELEVLETSDGQQPRPSVDCVPKQLRYRHWWFMWDPIEFFMVVEGDRVVRAEVKY